MSDVNALGGLAPQTAQFNQMPTADLLSPQNFASAANIQSPNNYYTPNASPSNYMQSPQANYGGQFVQPPYDPQNPQQQQPQINPNQIGFNMFQQPIMQDMAFQYGQKLADQGKELVNKELEKYVSVTKLKYYFAVDNKYVLNKLKLLFFPFTHKDWSLKYDQENAVQPRYDLNAPDLYIPTMGYITYIVLAGFILGMMQPFLLHFSHIYLIFFFNVFFFINSYIVGLQDRFSPEQLGIQASSALAYNIFELIIYTITLYVTNIQTTLRTLDLVAFSGYKYGSIVAILCSSILFSTMGYWLALLYSGSTLAFFLV